MPKSPLAYPDIMGLMEKTLASERGIRVRRETPGLAKNFILRCNSFRKAQRKASTEIYKEGDMMYGRTPYDHVSVRQDPEDPCSVLLIHLNPDSIEVEEL